MFYVVQGGCSCTARHGLTHAVYGAQPTYASALHVLCVAVRVCKLTEVLAAQVREKHRALLAQHHERFHPVWGQLLKTGYQNSRFAHQVGPALLG